MGQREFTELKQVRVRDLDGVVHWAQVARIYSDKSIQVWMGANDSCGWSAGAYQVLPDLDPTPENAVAWEYQQLAPTWLFSGNPIAVEAGWNIIARTAYEHPRAHEMSMVGCKPQRNETPGQAAKRAFDELQPKRESGEFHMTAPALWACVAAEAIAAKNAGELLQAGW